MNKLRMYSVSFTFRNTIWIGQLSANVLITSSIQTEDIFFYMKIGYVLNKKNPLLIFLTVILVF